MAETATKILIAEDDILLPIGVEAVIKKQGEPDLLKYSSGQILIETALEFAPDLIIADTLLKDSISGIEAVKEVKKTLPDVAYIYFTASSDPNLKKTAKEETGFIDYFVKPINLKRFKKRPG